MIGDVLMKKLIAASLAALFAAVSAAGVFAASSNVKIANSANKNVISFSYSPDNQATITRDITAIMTNLKNLTDKNSITQEIKITSESVNAKPVKFYLRLETPQTQSKQLPAKTAQTPVPQEYSAFDYYDILITTTDGEVVYNGKDAAKTSAEAQYKDMELLTLNYNDRASETKTYDITVSVNNDAKAQKKAAENLKWEIVTDGYTLRNGATPSPKPSLSPNPDASPSASETAQPAVTVSPVITQKPAGASLGTGSYIVGENLDAGRYELSGDGGVKVYTSDGYLKSNVKLTTADNSETAVKSYVVNLLDNEIVEVDGNVKLEPYTPVKTTPVPTLRPVATPKAAAVTTQRPVTAATSSTAVRPAATPRAAAASVQSTKTNPKTGDRVPLSAISALALISMAAVLYIEYRKRKNN